ncbi:hypothetical protein [Gimibacter soli]|uniref:Motility protein n=1 Tax=Gimibacter soli TaxID=3024400 RepID=A0AAF0BLQ6_9PROT|nr:hypothetical protein [Gimibacter soli]WCL55754.1 hypothetical protein PH603_08295 [Gimibacter soli]
MSNAVQQAAVAAISNNVKLSVAQDMAENTKKIQAQASQASSPSPVIEGAGTQVDVKV